MSVNPDVSHLSQSPLIGRGTTCVSAPDNDVRGVTFAPTWLNLVFNAVADFGEGFAHVVG